MTTPPRDFGAVVWESQRSVHAKCMDCRWQAGKCETNETAKRHTAKTGHSVFVSGLASFLVVPERSRQ